jgi:RES domain-containing protein
VHGSARDPQLLDALDAWPLQPFHGHVWRVVRVGRDPVEPSRAGGRWDRGRFDVLYTALDEDGAIAELDYHLRLQPVFPSRYEAEAHELTVATERALYFASLDELVPLGVDPARYREPLYSRSQEIGDAAAFLGVAALIVPSARWPCQNAVLMLDVEPVAPTLTVVGSRKFDFMEWRNTARSKRRER